MKRFIIPLLILCIAGLLAFEITSRCRCTPGKVKLDYLNNTDWLTNQLKLDANQAAELTKLHVEYRLKLEAAGKTHCAACCGLRAIIFESGSDEKTLALIDKMSSAQKENELATVKHIRQVYGLLNQDQKRIFENMVKICIGACGANGKCAGNCEAGASENSKK